MDLESTKNLNMIKKLFFSCNLFQKVKFFIHFKFITCKVKHFKSVFVLILMIRAYSS